MRKYFVLSVCMLYLAAACSCAWGDVPIDAAHFPDEMFRAYVMYKFDTDGNNILSSEEAGNAAIIYDLPGLGIASLKGIEHFPDLMGLDCSLNNLTELDLSGNPILLELYCSSNDIEQLNISENVYLSALCCDNNRLHHLDISGNMFLEALNCSSNDITELDTSRSISLQGLICSDNNITALDLTNSPGIVEVFCDNNALASLNVKGCASLDQLSCSNNELTSLDISGCGKLRVLNCGSNNLKTLTLNGNTALFALYCHDNSLQTLDLRKCPNLLQLFCPINNITALDLTSNAALAFLHCEGNLLSALDLSNNTNLQDLGCTFNLLASLDLSRNTALQVLDCSSNDIAALDLSANTALVAVSCDTELDTLYVVPSGRSDYPYRMDLAGYVGSDLSRVLTLKGYDESGREIASLLEDGALFAARPHHVVYEYNTKSQASPVMKVVVSMPSLHMYIPRAGSFWVANVQLDAEALANALGGVSASDVHTFHNIITSEVWTPASSDVSALEAAGREILFTLPEVQPDTAGTYVLLCVFSTGTSSGDKLAAYDLTDSGAEYVFLDEGYHVIDSVPESRQAYLAVKLSAGRVNRSVVASFPQSSSETAAPSGGSSGGCDSGLGLAGMICAFLGLCLTRKHAGVLTVVLVAVSASGSWADMKTADYTLPIEFKDYTPAGTCTESFTLSNALADRVAEEWAFTHITSRDVHAYADIALPGTWNFSPADSRLLSDAGGYGAALLPLTESGTAGGVYVALCVFSNDVQPGEMLEIFAMHIDPQTRDNAEEHIVSEEYTTENFGGANMIVLDENLNRVYTVPKNRRAYVAVSLSKPANTGIITVLRGRYVAESDPLSRINPSLAQFIADDFGIQVSELKYLTQEGLGAPREPTQAMKQYAASNDYEIILNMPTVSVDEGYKAVYFTYTLPDEVWQQVRGKSFTDFTVYAFNDSDSVGAGQVRSSFLNGVVSLWELSGGRMDHFGVREFVLAGLLQASRPFSFYLAKMLIMLLLGGCSSGINPLFVNAVILGLIVLKFPRKH